MGLKAAQAAIENAGIDPETLDYIIFAHNFGDVRFGTVQSDMVPSLAARVKHLLEYEIISVWRMMFYLAVRAG